MEAMGVNCGYTRGDGHGGDGHRGKPNIQKFVARLQLGLLRPDLYWRVALIELLRIPQGPLLIRT